MSQSPQPKPLSTKKAGPLQGRTRVPGDKSISHRALMFGAIATGVTRISGLLEAEDVLNTASAVTALGAQAQRSGGKWEVKGCGVGGLRQPGGPLDLGNSGTSTRLMLGLIAAHDMTVTLQGDASLSRRPMSRVLKPLRQMGLQTAGNQETLPLTVTGSSRLVPLTYELPVPSAQVKSAILLAGLGTAGETSVIEREATRDHTERMLRYFGASVSVEPDDGGGQRITVQGDAELSGREVTVPGDPSSAAFLVAAAVIVPGSDILVEGVLVNPTRTGFYTTLQEMGADVSFENEREEGGEPIADIRARYSALKGVQVPAERAPSMIDEYPVLAAVAGYAEGATRMEGLEELKVKESDRLTATAEGLIANGVVARADGDKLIVEGTGQVAGGGIVETQMDHRIAMAFLTMGLASEAPIGIDDSAMIATSFPEFQKLMESLGAAYV